MEAEIQWIMDMFCKASVVVAALDFLQGIPMANPRRWATRSLPGNLNMIQFVDAGYPGR